MEEQMKEMEERLRRENEAKSLAKVMETKKKVIQLLVESKVTFREAEDVLMYAAEECKYFELGNYRGC